MYPNRKAAAIRTGAAQMPKKSARRPGELASERRTGSNIFVGGDNDAELESLGYRGTLISRPNIGPQQAEANDAA